MLARTAAFRGPRRRRRHRRASSRRNRDNNDNERPVITCRRAARAAAGGFGTLGLISNGLFSIICRISLLRALCYGAVGSCACFFGMLCQAHIIGLFSDCRFLIVCRLLLNFGPNCAVIARSWQCCLSVRRQAYCVQFSIRAVSAGFLVTGFRGCWAC